ncbi:hypothetical protein ASE59_08190 [Sphingomonas sp. Leaf10]|nr:hypothetical protein ASE59_08190 [Sphingomonas sp. Leaf10]
MSATAHLPGNKEDYFMAFGNNSVLISTATQRDVEANGTNDILDAGNGANAFVIANGNVGNDQFTNWGSNDSIINNRQIFDGNGDGFIQFGSNGVLDIDRTSRRNAGQDQLQLTGANADITELRYLGSKNGGFVYADSATLKNLWEPFGRANVIEGTVGDNTFDMSGGSKVLFHDNALGLNLGGDTINNFGSDDLLVTTSMIFDSDMNQTVTFGQNNVLDISGSEGPAATDPQGGPGGQLDFTSQTSVTYLGSNQINGVTYYYYGTADSTFDPTPSA